jgi:hypothetical protein
MIRQRAVVGRPGFMRDEIFIPRHRTACSCSNR